MSLFQSTVVTKYLKTQNKDLVATKWNAFQQHFQNPSIQENIRNSKEEQYQGGFIIDLFVNILGYTKNPAPDFNITTEYKNVKDSKKADGAIIINNNVKAVVELKGTNTTDLAKVEAQAFGYKNNQPSCEYVIISNFEKLRFYIDNAIEHIEFNLFTLNQQQFELLFLCLALENIANDIPKKLKEQSVSHEDVITKTLYKDYSLFKRELHQNLVNLNQQIDKLTLFKKSQKLLDRFLFLFFAEDRQLLPPNSVRLVLKQWKQLKDLDEDVPLYNRFKKYFGYLNIGFKGKQYNVYAYNGGLFKPDEVLDKISIDDELLYQHTLKLSEYDFDSEVDVNILGHIFENSLNELDEIQAQLEGKGIDKSKTKRKKDGVFYTPKYITKYIVENTVGKLCEEKKLELSITDDNYQPAKQRSRKRINNLQQYRDWLLQLTICDPACGSGAFLNQALDYLIAEHRYIDELSAKYNKDAFILSDVEKSILENNLFGVDLNQESVEIAKLSLWLRTAQPNRKLNDLSNNIKCGNSLIDAVEIAGNKAFNWQHEFPHIFAKGGFDVVIGNPPYVLCQPSNTTEDILEYYKSFEVASYKIDLFHLFFEKSIELIANESYLGFITPNTYLTNKFIKPLRNYILKNTSIISIINHQEPVFPDAGVDVSTIILNKTVNQKNKIEVLKSEKGGVFTHFSTKKQSSWIENEDNIFNLKNEFRISFNGCVPLFDICNSYFGIQAYDRKSSISNKKLNEDYLPIIDGGDIFPYIYSVPIKYFNYREERIKSGGDFNVYKEERIVIRQIGITPIVGLCKGGILGSNTLYNINLRDKNYDLKYLLCVLNSKLIKEYWLAIYSDGKQLFPKIKGYQLKSLPIKEISKKNQQSFIEKADEMILLNKEMQQLVAKFNRTLQRKFEIEKLTKKLQEWHLLSFADFVKELKKKKVKLTLQQEAEWEDYFLAEQQKALDLKAKIDQTDREIDAMVYELYGLSEDEIGIIEKSI